MSVKLVAQLEAHSDYVSCLRLDTANKILFSGSYDSSIVAWDLKSNTVLTKFISHSDSETARGVRCLELSVDRKWLFSGSDDEIVRRWSLSNMKTTPIISSCDSLRGHDDWVNALCVDSNGFLFSGSSDDRIKQWDTATGTYVRDFLGHDRSVTCLQVVKATLFSGSYDMTLRAWNIASAQCVAIFTGHTGWVRSLYAGSNGCLYSGSEDSTIRVWDSTAGDNLLILPGHSVYVKSLHMMDGVLLSSSGDGSIRKWTNSATRPRDEKSRGCSAVIKCINTAIAVESLSTIFVGTADGKIKICTISADSEEITAPAFPIDSQIIADASSLLPSQRSSSNEENNAPATITTLEWDVQDIRRCLDVESKARNQLRGAVDDTAKRLDTKLLAVSKRTDDVEMANEASIQTLRGLLIKKIEDVEFSALDAIKKKASSLTSTVDSLRDETHTEAAALKSSLDMTSNGLRLVSAKVSAVESELNLFKASRSDWGVLVSSSDLELVEQKIQSDLQQLMKELSTTQKNDMLSVGTRLDDLVTMIRRETELRNMLRHGVDEAIGKFLSKAAYEANERERNKETEGIKKLLETSREDIQNNRQGITSIDETVSILKSSICDLGVTQNDLRQRTAHCAEKISDSHLTTTKELSTLNTMLLDSIDRLESRISSTTSKQDSLESQLQELRVMQRDMTNALSRNMPNVSASDDDDEEEKRSKLLASMSTLSSSTQEKIGAVSSRVSVTEDAIANCKSQVQQLETVLSDLATQISCISVNDNGDTRSLVETVESIVRISDGLRVELDEEIATNKKVSESCRRTDESLIRLKSDVENAINEMSRNLDVTTELMERHRRKGESDIEKIRKEVREKLVTPHPNAENMEFSSKAIQDQISALNARVNQVVLNMGSGLKPSLTASTVLRDTNNTLPVVVPSNSDPIVKSVASVPTATAQATASVASTVTIPMEKASLISIEDIPLIQAYTEALTSQSVINSQFEQELKQLQHAVYGEDHHKAKDTEIWRAREQQFEIRVREAVQSDINETREKFVAYFERLRDGLRTENTAVIEELQGKMDNTVHELTGMWDVFAQKQLVKEAEINQLNEERALRDAEVVAKVETMKDDLLQIANDMSSTVGDRISSIESLCSDADAKATLALHAASTTREFVASLSASVEYITEKVDSQFLSVSETWEAELRGLRDAVEVEASGRQRMEENIKDCIKKVGTVTGEHFTKKVSNLLERDYATKMEELSTIIKDNAEAGRLSLDNQTRTMMASITRHNDDFKKKHSQALNDIRSGIDENAKAIAQVVQTHRVDVGEQHKLAKQVKGMKDIVSALEIKTDRIEHLAEGQIEEATKYLENEMRSVRHHLTEQHAHLATRMSDIDVAVKQTLELRQMAVQMKEFLLGFASLRKDLDQERQQRVALENEIRNLKRQQGQTSGPRVPAAPVLSKEREQVLRDSIMQDLSKVHDTASSSALGMVDDVKTELGNLRKRVREGEESRRSLEKLVADMISQVREMVQGQKNVVNLVRVDRRDDGEGHPVEDGSLRESVGNHRSMRQSGLRR